jgi:broad specificity phosphatase PhoE
MDMNTFFSHGYEQVGGESTRNHSDLQIILIRPGATILDEQGRIKGDLDLPLSPNGMRQVEALVQQVAQVPIESIYTSPCVSSRQTADALAAQSGARVRIESDLRNLDHGLWEGKRFEELKQTQPRIYRLWADHPENVSPPGGERLEDAEDRVARFLNRLFRRTKSGVVAVVIAEPLASILRGRLLSRPIDNFWEAEQRVGDWEVITIRPATQPA